MKMGSFDESRMYAAISKAGEHLDLPVQKGYIHRATGAIVFVSENEGRARDWQGKEAAIDMASDRAEIHSNPDQWVEIPKYDGPNGGEDAFIQQFLKEHGLDA
jgi:hypothetical protein